MRRRLALLAAIGLACIALIVALSRGDEPTRREPSGSTLRATLIDPDGDGALAPGPGEPLRVRTELGPASAPGRILATLGQLTDTHVRDEESPARVAFLDRLGRPFTPTFRPQEALTTQTLAAALRSLNAARPDALLVSGDIADNPARAELDAAVATLRGGRVNPDTGGRGYEGPQRAENPDPSFYRPDVDPPRHPGLLVAAQRAFVSPGSRAPWLPLPGNHDVLVAGEVAPTQATNRVATGRELLVRPAEGLDVPRDPAGASARVNALIAGGVLPGETERIAPDPRRAFVTPARARAILRGGSDLPRLATGPRGPGLSSIVPIGTGVVLVTLDLDQAGEGAGGVVTGAHVAFVRRALAAAGKRWILFASHQPLRKAGGEVAALRALLDASPRVLAALAGDTHTHSVSPRRTASGGYWELETAALADFPQQARMLRVRATAGGGVMLESWVLDTAPDPLADVSRELAFLDAQGGRPGGNRGGRLDRNVALFRSGPRP